MHLMSVQHVQETVPVFSGRTVLWAAVFAGTGCFCTAVGYYVYGRCGRKRQSQRQSGTILPCTEGKQGNICSSVDKPAGDEADDSGIAEEDSTEINSQLDECHVSNVHIKHPLQEGQEALGMELSSEPLDDFQCHILRKVSSDGLAYQMGLRTGDELLRLNEMSVTNWSHHVLVEQFCIIAVKEICIGVKRRKVEEEGEEEEEKKQRFEYLEYHATVRVQETKLHGEVIDVKTITIHKNLQVILGSPQRQKCYVQHVPSGLYVQLDRENSIGLGPLRDEDPTFTVERVMFHAMEDDIHSVHCGDEVIVFLFKVNDSNKYISILGKNQPLGVQHHERIHDHTDYLKSADPRFFYHKFTATGQDTFESTELPGNYLASDGKTLYLKKQETGPLSDDCVHFKVWYGKPL